MEQSNVWYSARWQIEYADWVNRLRASVYAVANQIEVFSDSWMYYFNPNWLEIIDLNKRTTNPFSFTQNNENIQDMSD